MNSDSNQSKKSGAEPKAIRPEIEPIDEQRQEEKEDMRGSAVRTLLSAILLCVIFGGTFAYWTGWSPTQLSLGLPTDEHSDATGEISEVFESQLADATQASNNVPSRPSSEFPPLSPYLPKTTASITEECIAVGEHLASRHPESPDAQEMLARANYEFGRADEAKRIWREIVKLDENYAYALRGLGDLATLEGELGAAVDYYRRSVVAQPGDLSRQFALANALIANDESDEALKVLDGMLQQNPKDGSAQLKRGQILFQQDQIESAKAAYLVASQAMPDDAQVDLGLAQTYARLGDRDKAELHRNLFKEKNSAKQSNVTKDSADYDDEKAIQADVAVLLTDMARVYVALGEPKSGQYLLQRACRLSPENINAKQALSWTYLQEQKPFLAIRWLREVSKLQPKELSYVAEMARIYVETEQLEDAESVLLEFLEREPEQLEAKSLLSQYYATALGNLPQAVKLAKEIVASDNSTNALIWLATLYEQTEDIPKAIEAYELAAETGEVAPELEQKLALLKAHLKATVSPPESSEP